MYFASLRLCVSPWDGDPLDAARGDDLPDLLHGQDLGEGLGVLELHRRQRLPRAFAGSRVIELDAREGDTNGAVGELLDVLEVEKILPELPFGDLVRRRLGPISELPDCTEIAMNGPLAICRSSCIASYPKNKNEIRDFVGRAFARTYKM